MRQAGPLVFRRVLRPTEQEWWDCLTWMCGRGGARVTSSLKANLAWSHMWLEGMALFPSLEHRCLPWGSPFLSSLTASSVLEKREKPNQGGGGTENGDRFRFLAPLGIRSMPGSCSASECQTQVVSVGWEHTATVRLANSGHWSGNHPVLANQGPPTKLKKPSCVFPRLAFSSQVSPKISPRAPVFVSYFCCNKLLQA